MFTGILWRFLILETFVLGALCRFCLHKHPQKQFCTSEYVLKVTFHKRIGLPVDRMKILKVFKGNVVDLNITNIKLEMVRRYNFLETKYYFVFGRKEYGNIYNVICKGNQPVMANKFYMRGLAHFYKTGCDCVRKMPRYTKGRYCLWKYSFLKRREGKCTWTKTAQFRLCRKGSVISPPSK